MRVTKWVRLRFPSRNSVRNEEMILLKEDADADGEETGGEAGEVDEETQEMFDEIVYPLVSYRI